MRHARDICNFYSWLKYHVLTPNTEQNDEFELKTVLRKYKAPVQIDYIFQIDENVMQISAFRTEAAILSRHELQTSYLMDNKIRHTQKQIFLNYIF